MERRDLDRLGAQGVGDVYHRLIGQPVVILVGRFAELRIDVFHHLHVDLVGNGFVQQELGVERAGLVGPCADQGRGQLVAGQRPGGQFDARRRGDLQGVVDGEVEDRQQEPTLALPYCLVSLPTSAVTSLPPTIEVSALAVE